MGRMEEREGAAEWERFFECLALVDWRVEGSWVSEGRWMIWKFGGRRVEWMIGVLDGFRGLWDGVVGRLEGLGFWRVWRVLGVESAMALAWGVRRALNVGDGKRGFGQPVDVCTSANCGPLVYSCSNRLSFEAHGGRGRWCCACFPRW